MAGKHGKKNAKGEVIVKKYEIVEGGHHGGAWKVAYADFVTAMMAFFLLMWLLNATTEDQRKGLADYFSPNSQLSHGSSGTGQPFGGHTAFDQGALVSDRGAEQITAGKLPVVERTEDGDDPVFTEAHRAISGEGVGKGPAADDQDVDDTDQKPLGQKETRPAPGPGGTSVVERQGQPADPRAVTPAEIAAEKDRQEKAAFEHAADEIKQAVHADPQLAELSKQLAIDMTPDGLRIQIVDEVKLPMFPTGSSVPNERARLLIQKIVPILMKLHEPLSIAGHTDAAPFPGPDRTNWELSAERANATRRLLTDGGTSRDADQIGDRRRRPGSAVAGRSPGRGESADCDPGDARRPRRGNAGRPDARCSDARCADARRDDARCSLYRSPLQHEALSSKRC